MTVSDRAVVTVRLPETPVTLTVAVPMVAVVLAVRVSTSPAKAAETPVGKPERENVTLPVKPFTGTTVIVLVLLLPCATESVAGDAVRVNEAAAGADKVAAKITTLRLAGRVRLFNVFVLFSANE